MAGTVSLQNRDRVGHTVAGDKIDLAVAVEVGTGNGDGIVRKADDLGQGEEGPAVVEVDGDIIAAFVNDGYPD